MRSKKMANLYSRLASYSQKNGKKHIEIVVHLAKSAVKFSTGISIFEDEWDEDLKCIRGKTRSVKDDNLIIDNLKAKINNVLVKYRLIEKSLTPERLRAEVMEAPNLNFIDFISSIVEKEKGMLAPATTQTHESLITKLTMFRAEVFCSDIDEDFVKEFITFMITNLKNKRTTAAKTITTLKRFVKQARKKGLIGDDPFDDIRISKKNPEAVFLIEPELNLLINLYFNKSLNINHQKVLRYFLFSCFTGLRLVDVKRVCKDNIVGNTLVVVPEKTKKDLKQVHIPLTDNAWKMINDSIGTHNKKTIFDCYEADNTTRSILKKVCTAAGIKKNVTFHTARHTFATIFLRHNRNLRTLQALLGHSDIRETSKYSHVLDEDKVDGIKVFDKIFIQHLAISESPNVS
jgi:site-specific recombinase XerD